MILENKVSIYWVLHAVCDPGKKQAAVRHIKKRVAFHTGRASLKQRLLSRWNRFKKDQGHHRDREKPARTLPKPRSTLFSKPSRHLEYRWSQDENIYLKSLVFSISETQSLLKEQHKTSTNVILRYHNWRYSALNKQLNLFEGVQMQYKLKICSTSKRFETAISLRPRLPLIFCKPKNPPA